MRPIELLQAIADGEVIQTHAGIGRRYELGGAEIGYMSLHSLKRQGWILVPLAGPPEITPDGITWLRNNTHQ